MPRTGKLERCISCVHRLFVHLPHPILVGQRNECVRRETGKQDEHEDPGRLGEQRPWTGSCLRKWRTMERLSQRECAPKRFHWFSTSPRLPFEVLCVACSLGRGLAESWPLQNRNTGVFIGFRCWEWASKQIDGRYELWKGRTEPNAAGREAGSAADNVKAGRKDLLCALISTQCAINRSLGSSSNPPMHSADSSVDRKPARWAPISLRPAQ